MVLLRVCVKKLAFTTHELKFLSGWKKRLFHLKDGHLTYFVHNKPRFKVDLQTAVIVTNSKKCRIEIDTGVDILHLRAKVCFCCTCFYDHHIQEYSTISLL